MMLKIATWNLNKPVSQKRQAEMQKYIEEQQADVWVFTEAHESFTKQLGFRCAKSSAAKRDGRFSDEHHWVSICSNHKLELLATTDQKRTVAVRVSPDNADPFVVFGTLLPWHGDNWCGHESAGGVAFSEALIVQSGDWKRLRERYPADEFFVAGDFNQDLVDKPPKYYGSKTNRTSLENALKANDLMALTGGKNDPVRRESLLLASISHNEFPCASIDHICGRFDSKWNVSKTMRWPQEKKPVRWISDHFGVAVELDRKTLAERMRHAQGMLRGMDTTIEREPDREL